MKPTASAVGTLAVVAAGQWAEDKGLSIGLVVGAGFFAFGLTLMANMNEQFASQFALLVFIVALFRYIPTIGKKAGLIKG